MPLTATAVLNAKAGINSKGIKTNKPYKLSDGQGLILKLPPKAKSIGDLNTGLTVKRKDSQ